MRPSVQIASIGLLLAVLTGCTAAATPKTTTAIKFHFDWIPTSGDVPMLAADKNGYFTDAGLSVTTTPGGPEVNCATLVAAGSQDICISPAVGIIGAAPQGVPYHSIGLIQQKAPYGLIMGPNSGVTTPKDLVGKKLGTQTDNGYYALWKAFEKAQGLDASKITEVAVGFGPEPIFTGTVDGIMDFISLDPALVEQHYSKKPVTFLFADYNAWAAGQAIIVNDAFAAAHPQAVTAFVTAYGKGMRWALDNQSAAIDLVVASYKDLTKDVVSAELPALLKFWTSPDTDKNGLLYQGQDLWQRTSDMLHEFKVVTQPVDVTKVYTDKYWTKGL